MKKLLSVLLSLMLSLSLMSTVTVTVSAATVITTLTVDQTAPVGGCTAGEIKNLWNFSFGDLTPEFGASQTFYRFTGEGTPSLESEEDWSELSEDDRFETGEVYSTVFYCKLDDPKTYEFDPALAVTSEQSSAVKVIFKDNASVLFGIIFDPAGGNSPSVSGDVNNDGGVDMKDVLIIRKYIAKMIGETALNLVSADANGDGSVDMKDVLIIRKFIANLVERLGS
ncbi:MAG: dockerin type I repeat-containing protein [Clostridia bacterium]|nr:dockerin type I repeat-containing protein [Clostridia bacterium]